MIVLVFTSQLTRNTPGKPTTIGTLAMIVAMLPGVLYAGRNHHRGVALRVDHRVVAMLLLGSVELEQTTQKPEIAALLLLGAAGGVVFAAGGDLLSTAVGLETLSLASITLVALTRAWPPLEAAFKYFVLTTISTAVLIFGLGLLFMATGSVRSGPRLPQPIRHCAGC